MKKILISSFVVLTGFIIFSFFYRGKASTAKTAVTPQVAGKSTSLVGFITPSDIRKHSTRNSCWMAIDGKVYDLTQFIDLHPGGPTIIQGCGKDATQIFDSIHSNRAKNLLARYFIGKYNS